MTRNEAEPKVANRGTPARLVLPPAWWLRSRQMLPSVGWGQVECHWVWKLNCYKSLRALVESFARGVVGTSPNTPLRLRPIAVSLCQLESWQL
jgi:hypothetical protein